MSAEARLARGKSKHGLFTPISVKVRKSRMRYVNQRYSCPAGKRGEPAGTWGEVRGGEGRGEMEACSVSLPRNLWYPRRQNEGICLGWEASGSLNEEGGSANTLDLLDCLSILMEGIWGNLDTAAEEVLRSRRFFVSIIALNHGTNLSK